MAKYQYTISYTKRLEALMQKEIDEILKKIGEDVTQKVKDYIQKYWYDTYTPKDYTRTDSLLESVSYKIEDGTVIVYIDEGKFQYGLQDGWGSHISFNGERFGSELIQFVENGIYDSGEKGSSRNPRIGDASHAIERVNKWLERYVKAEVRSRINMAFGLS
jgi:hypothetical protein